MTTDTAANKKRITPRYIDSLKEGEVFVFGSNKKGMHGGGAAAKAFCDFGAEWGVGVGMTYHIPDKRTQSQQGLPLLPEQEHYRLHRMMEDHPWTAIAHHLADPFPHILPVAMHRTLVALGLVLAELASVKPRF